MEVDVEEEEIQLHLSSNDDSCSSNQPQQRNLTVEVEIHAPPTKSRHSEEVHAPSKASSDELSDILKKQKLSLIVDESTDKGDSKNLVLATRYFGSKVCDARDRFFDLITLPEGKADHVSLYNSVKTSFEQKDVPYKENLIGFGADGCNVMHGCHHSVKTLLMKDCPFLFTSTCICHSFAL
nr:PREDICTED: uncharacterized protein LOC109032383 [Bemisia tabaci]